VAVITAANRRADLAFDRIVPAVPVQPTLRNGEMSISTTTPKPARRRRRHPLAAITAIAAILALAAWAIATYAVDARKPSGRSSAATQPSMLRELTPAGREYVLGVMSMPVEMQAAFGTSPASVQGRQNGRPAQAVRSGAPTLASVLRSLNPTERRYVLGIASLTPLQLWAAFGTTPTPPVVRRGPGSTIASGATTSRR
jgi:hypothetical protein